ncbi:terminase small subunit [Scatolibacter rhodanostii]|uniref:terminase small subunit n=1 Tax=Scatolibacter rhodanostii TaxID=2014781 RepID=UPI00117D83E6|nr:terminase small subunit [Scatolibacter rhodanostii]
MAKTDLKQKAKDLYDKGVSLADIANQLNISASTVRSWKSRYKWDSVATERSVAEKRCNTTEPPKPQQPPAELTEPLTENERLFCEVYMRNKNATQAYLKVYGCSYNSAMTTSCNMLRKPKIKAYLNYLRECQREAINLQPIDIVERYMHIAFSDITDFVDFGSTASPVYDEKGNITGSRENEFFRLYDAQMVNGGVIKEIKQTQNGIAIKLEDRTAALSWLSDYFEMNPSDRHRREYDKRKLEMELLRMQSDVKELAEEETLDDGFTAALGVKAAEVWKKGDDNVG